jgi:endo-1,4-beta-xylanase
LKKLTIAISLAITFAFAEDACLQNTSLNATATGAQTWTGKKGATTLGGSGDDAYGVETWTEAGGDATKFTWFGPNQGGGFAFRAEWTNSTDYLGRFGYFWGIDGKKWDKLGDLCVDYNYKRSNNGTGGSYSYIGVYGWTINGNNTEAEYYIVEDWFGENQQGANNLGNGCQEHGKITVDGKEYQVVTCIRPAGSGCVTCNGQQFGQVFSIRQGMRSGTPKTCGTISIKKHFEEWTKMTTEKSGQSPAKYIYAKTYESKFLAEAQGGTGWLETTFLKFSRNGTCGFDIPAGNYTLELDVSPSEGGTASRNPKASYYPSGTSVTLTATPASGWKFASWGGDASGTASTTTITINANKNVIAKFSPIADPDKNLVTNGTFTNKDGWTFNSGSSYGNSEGNFDVQNKEAKINVTKTGSNVWEPQLVQNGITLVEGMNYRITFEASATAARKIGVIIQKAGGEYDTYFEKEIDLTSTKQTFTYDFKMEFPSDESGRIGFNFGQATGNITISNVKLNYIADDTPGTSSSSGTTQSSSGTTTQSSSATVSSSSRAASSSSGTASSSSRAGSSSSANSTPITSNTQLAANPTPQMYYSLKGEPLGSAKPQKVGVYIVKQGYSVKKIVVRQ